MILCIQDIWDTELLIGHRINSPKEYDPLELLFPGNKVD